MSPSEIAWRAASLSRDWLDRFRIPLGAHPKLDASEVGENLDSVRRGFSLERDSQSFSEADVDGTWLPELLESGQEILSGKLTYFGQSKRNLGHPVDWHKDHSAQKRASRSLIQRIDYRDFTTNGDCKEVWEPNRHHQFVVLSRAYAASGELRYAEGVVDQMTSWIQDNPFGYGMNWRSPLELGVRLINWVFAIELIRTSGLLAGQRWKDIYGTVYLHCWEISRKLSRGSSANNHLVGELAGLYVAASYFPDLPNADKWKARCHEALVKELLRQSYSDGCTKEQALGYQFFVMQFYLVCGLVGRWTATDFSTPYWSRLQAMIEFAVRMGEFGPLPLFGDQDDGYVLDLGDDARNIVSLLDVGKHLFSMSECTSRVAPAKPSQSGYWLFGKQDQLPQNDEKAQNPCYSVAFAESGYYLLQHKTHENALSVVFDCAELGYGSIAAHGHADALSFTLRANGHYILVDPGTFDYFTYPDYRAYFRSTAAHNTIRVDGQDQSRMHGPFMWGQQARSRCLDFSIADTRTTVCGEHDGYRVLADPVVHKRTVSVDANISECLIVDELTADGDHEIEAFFHFGPTCDLVLHQDNRIVMSVAGKMTCELLLDESLSTMVYHGSEDPISGWYSSGYHQKFPAPTIVGSGKIAHSSSLRHRIRLLRRQ